MPPVERFPGDSSLAALLDVLPARERGNVMTGAIPHWLDDGIAELLFPGEAAASLEAIAELRFLSEGEPGRLVYSQPVREGLLDLWQREDPDRFRQISGALAREFQRRTKAEPERSDEYSTEWLFHSLAADPEEGMRLTVQLFHELLSSRETGPAERLVRLASEQAGWLGHQRGWLTYFPAALAFSRYEATDLSQVKELEKEYPDTLLAACALHLMGDQAARQAKWAAGRELMVKALEIAAQQDDLETTSRIHESLGDLYCRWVQGAGGILREERDFASPLHAFLYGLVRGPLLLYRRLSERVNAIPNLYGATYQNWVAMRLMRLARDNYRAARRGFTLLNNHRELAELATRMSQVELDLGYADTARRMCAEALKQPLFAASPYYRAKAGQVMALADRRAGAQSITLLADSLRTLERYGDWEAATRAALDLAHLHARNGDPLAAVAAYERCLRAARRSEDLLAQTEVARGLDGIAASGGEAGTAAASLRETIRRTVYIDRFPGPVQKTFQRLATWLAYPFVLLFVISVVAASTLPLQIIEGELRLNLDPVRWTDLPVQLGIGVLAPLIIVWLYQAAYILVGQVVAAALNFSEVDKSQPGMFILDEHGITQVDAQGAAVQHMRWQSIQRAVQDNRALYRNPLTFSARTVLKMPDKKMKLPATITRYLDLRETAASWLARAGNAGRILRIDLSVLRTRWLLLSLAGGAAIGIAEFLGAFGPPAIGCYGRPGVDEIKPGMPCPAGHELFIQPAVQLALLSAILIFLIVTLVRWQAANRAVARALAEVEKPLGVLSPSELYQAAEEKKPEGGAGEKPEVKHDGNDGNET